MKTKIFLLVMSISLVLFSANLSAQVPRMINYQGKLTTPAGLLIDGVYSMTFNIYDAAVGGSSLWNETQPAVTVDKGVFSVLLGSVNSIPDSVFQYGAIRYLGVQVGADPEMAPRKEIVSVGYAINCDMVDGKHAGKGSFLQVYAYGTVAPGGSKTLTIPHYFPWRLELSSGWPHIGGVCDILGFENDWNIAITYVKYNGDGTSAAGGAEGFEPSNTVLVSFGSGAFTYTVKCPNEGIGDHNIVITAAGVELFYKLSW